MLGTIIQGARKPYRITITEKVNGVTSPLDLTNNEEITVCFKTTAGLVIHTRVAGGEVAVDNAVLGIISGALSIADTASFAKDSNGIIEVAVDFGGDDVRKLQILQAFIIEETLCG